MQHSTAFHSDKPPVETVHFLGNLLTFRAGAADTDNQFSITECLTAPGAGAPPHSQTDAEAFLVTEGQYEFLLNGTQKICGKGDFLFVRAGDVHAFRNPGEVVARMLIINLPAGQHEGFFRAVGDAVAPETEQFPAMGEPDMPRIFAAAENFGITLLPPPKA
ncbi:cupin domain-containing protein [Martelella limonii]|uniref:cupin domain-containing protein n=1 Tax=Martelella limonii TaxID=1647649 RepID=UPI0015809AC5|nr:cupin domain-containing protein [Martelella limonii]